MQKVINFGARIVCNMRRHDRITPALSELGWCRVEDMITERDLTIIRDLLSDTRAPELLRDNIIHRSSVSVRATRATADALLQLPRVRTEFARRAFMFRASKGWNALPADVRVAGAASRSAFKASLKSHMSDE